MSVTWGHIASRRDHRHDAPCGRSLEGEAHADAALDGAGAGTVIAVLLAARRLHHHRHGRDLTAGFADQQGTTDAATGAFGKNLRLAARIGDSQRQCLISQCLFIAQVAAAGLDISEPGLGKALQRLAVGIETLYSNIQLALCLVSDQAPLRLPFPLRVYRQRQGLDIAVCQTKLLQDGGASR